MAEMYTPGDKCHGSNGEPFTRKTVVLQRRTDIPRGKKLELGFCQHCQSWVGLKVNDIREELRPHVNQAARDRRLKARGVR